MVKVRDLEVGKNYNVDGISKTLVKKELGGKSGVSYNLEPYYNLTFGNDNEISKDWYIEYDEAVSGGKRKSRLNRKIRRKSKKNRRKSSRRR
jgi:hypothetical protein